MDDRRKLKRKERANSEEKIEERIANDEDEEMDVAPQKNRRSRGGVGNADDEVDNEEREDEEVGIRRRRRFSGTAFSKLVVDFVLADLSFFL